MSRIKTGLSIAFLTASLGACSKTGSPPTGFGVNITVDGSAVSTSDRMKIATGQLHILSDKAGATVITRSVEGFQSAIAGGVVHFHYTPGADVMAGDSLTFELDGLDAAGGIVASGTSPKVTLAATAVATTIPLAGSSADGSVPGDGSPGDGSPGDAVVGDVNPDGKANGVGCLTNAECGTGFCTDGVCCNEKCDDVCVSCNGATTKGTCTPYAANTDPEMECAAKIPPTMPSDDGGTMTADGSAEAGAAEAGAATDASASDAAADGGASDALAINTPDGGFTTMPTSCAGTCGGARKCNYPGTTKSCGTPFCNSRKDVASFVCDGAGSCAIAVDGCSNFACDDSKGACRTTCSDPSHCLDDSYCTGTGACTTRKGNSISCTLPSECASGYCSGGVCCNDACDGPGQSCIQAGKVGQCQCIGVTCAAGVACQVFYQDLDHDTYGNASGTIAGGTAIAGCTGSPPTGFVADHTDCDDNNANAHPNQTSFFGTARANGTYDYDCNGSEDEQTPEYVGGSCKFCGPTTNCAATTTSCTSTSQTESFQCPLEGTTRVISEPVLTESASSASLDSPVPSGTTTPNSRAASEPSLIAPISPIQPIFLNCCGCRAADKSGFTTTVKCGSYAYVTTCGTCTGSAAGGASLTYTQQLCH
jgi:hypothetical protein